MKDYDIRWIQQERHAGVIKKRHRRGSDLGEPQKGEDPGRAGHDPITEHRRHPRLLPTGSVVTLRTSKRREMPARVLDVSAEGLCLEIGPRHGLVPNQAVHVRFRDGDWVLALVAHADAGHIGIWFGEPVPPEGSALVRSLVAGTP